MAVTISDAAAANAFFALQALGQANRYPDWMEWTAPRFEITSAAEVEIGVDGEALRMTPPVVFEIQPGGAAGPAAPARAAQVTGRPHRARAVPVHHRRAGPGGVRGQPALSLAARPTPGQRTPQLGPDRQVV